MPQAQADGQGRSPSTAASSADRLRAAQVEILYDQAPVAIAATLAAALVIVGVFWSVSPLPRLLAWLGAYLLITLLRIGLVLRFRRATPEQRRDRRWLQGAMAGIAASGVIWGATVPLLPPSNSLLYEGFVTLWVCGLGAGSLAALSVFRPAFFAFLLPATLPGAAYLLAQETPAAVTVGGGILMFAGFLSLNAVRMHQTLLRSLQLQFENSDLAADLAADKREIELLNVELERRIAERTADLRAANEAKSRFLAAASHDLRQPIQMLSLLQAALAITVREAETRKIVRDMGEGLRVTAGMLDELAEVSRLERGGIQPQSTTFPIAEVFDRLRRELGPSARDKGLRLRIVTSRAVVRSDKVLLERILRNLLSNAIKYTEAGGVLVGARHRGGELRIEVWDTGAGIAADQIGKIFEEFYQLDNPARERGKGQGLGLAIVDRTARLLGHPVSVRSAPGKGSVFCVQVPLGRSVSTPATPASGFETHAPASAALQILLVEDDDDVRRATSLLLELCGWHVVSVRNGTEAAERCKRDGRCPDVLIADYRLPGGETGVDVVEQLRAIVGRKVPAVIVTGDTSAESERAVRTCGCGLLRKPIVADELVASVATAVPGPSAADQETAATA
jgi:signal transduction histidine kinase/CheY-like chemotaxis protein